MDDTFLLRYPLQKFKIWGQLVLALGDSCLTAMTNSVQIRIALIIKRACLKFVLGIQEWQPDACKTLLQLHVLWQKNTTRKRSTEMLE